jgi:hypothetical protein
MTDVGDTQFQKGQPVWVIDENSSQRAAEYVGEGETSSRLGGKTKVIVVYLDAMPIWRSLTGACLG